MQLFVHQKKGFTLLYATLVSALLLAIGLAVYNITIKQFLLSATERESQLAFYAADAGIECALYWDFRTDLNYFDPNETHTITCNEMNLPVGGALAPEKSTFSLPDPHCVTVDVTKFEMPTRTLIEARGYNTCNVNDPRRVERALRVRY